MEYPSPPKSYEYKRTLHAHTDIHNKVPGRTLRDSKAYYIHRNSYTQMSKKDREPMEPKLSAKTKTKKTHTFPRGFCGKYGLLSGSKRDLLRVVLWYINSAVAKEGVSFLEMAIRNVLWNARILLEMYYIWLNFLVFLFDKVLCYAHPSFFHPSPTPIINITTISYPPPPPLQTPPSQSIHGPKIHNRISPAHANPNISIIQIFPKVAGCSLTYYLR